MEKVEAPEALSKVTEDPSQPGRVFFVIKWASLSSWSAEPANEGDLEYVQKERKSSEGGPRNSCA
ncbi:MAG: hypothetical protein ACKO4U_08405, partial [Caldilinea sp.]